MYVYIVQVVCENVNCPLPSSLLPSPSQIMRALLEHSGQAKRGSELFETRSALSFTKKLLKGLKVSVNDHIIRHMIVMC